MPTRVGLVQINSAFSGQYYLPYSVGCLQAYAEQHLERPHDFEFLLPIFQRLRIAEAVERLKDAEVVAFSTYVWNIRLSLAIAEALKRRNPEVVIAFGGPQVSYYVRPLIQPFLKKHPYVDLTIHGEGEQPFLAILQQVRNRNWEAVPSASFLDKTGRYVETKKVERFRHLTAEDGTDIVPSPYTSGTFDRLTAAYPEVTWIATQENNRGCPYRCTYCAWGEAVNQKVARWSFEHSCRDITWFAEREIPFVFCADANFGIFPEDVGLARVYAATKRRCDWPRWLSLQDAKNNYERVFEIRKTLQPVGLNTGVVVSNQSLDSSALVAVKRENLKQSAFAELARRYNREGIEFMTDLILGLPAETCDSFANGIATLIELGQHHRVQINIFCDVPDAEASSPAYQRQYGLKKVETGAVNIHGVIEEEEVPERQELVIATQAMPPQDWVRAWVYGRTAALLHFDKLLQPALIACHELSGGKQFQWLKARCRAHSLATVAFQPLVSDDGGVTYCNLFELFTNPKLDADAYPLLTGIRQFLEAKARAIQSGEVEYCYSAEWLGIHWPADEYLFIQFAVEGRLEQFYDEAERLLAANVSVDRAVLRDAIVLNKNLIKMPFQSQDLEVECSSNIWEFWRSVLVGEPVPVIRAPHRYRIDRSSERWESWAEWCQKVVWWGNKRGAYLYGNVSAELKLAGHF